MIRQWTLKEWIMEQHCPPEVADKIEQLFKLPDKLELAGLKEASKYVDYLLNSPSSMIES